MMKLSSASNEGKFNCSLFTISEYGYRLRRVFETLSRDYGLGLNLDSYDWDGYIYLWLSDILSLKLMWSEASKLFDDELAGEFLGLIKTIVKLAIFTSCPIPFS